jgi:exopolysaccharide production protein ExoZ
VAEKLRSIQVLRGLAAFGVVLCHANLLHAGAAGVDVFFVISGFVISGVMIGRQPADFLAARCWRIFPLTWLCSIPWFLAAIHNGAGNWRNSIATFTLWPILGGYVSPYLQSSWTLCYEMLFYYAATLALIVGGARWLILGFLVCFAANLMWPEPLLGFLGFPPIFNFLLGAALRRAPLRAGLGIPAIAIGLVAISFGPAVAFELDTQTTGLLRLAWWTAPSVLIVYGALSLEDRFTKWADGLVFLGDASFSLYLVHLVPLVIFPPLIGIPLAILLGFALHFGLERRLLAVRFRRRDQGVVLLKDMIGT